MDIISVDFVDGEGDCEYVEEHQADRQSWEEYWNGEEVYIVPEAYLGQAEQGVDELDPVLAG